MTAKGLFNNLPGRDPGITALTLPSPKGEGGKKVLFVAFISRATVQVR
jgi:hypothetical protein